MLLFTRNALQTRAIGARGVVARSGTRVLEDAVLRTELVRNDEVVQRRKDVIAAEQRERERREQP
jgi:hypothetical protein